MCCWCCKIHFVHEFTRLICVFFYSDCECTCEQLRISISCVHKYTIQFFQFNLHIYSINIWMLLSLALPLLLSLFCIQYFLWLLCISVNGIRINANKIHPHIIHECYQIVRFANNLCTLNASTHTLGYRDRKVVSTAATVRRFLHI